MPRQSTRRRGLGFETRGNLSKIVAAGRISRTTRSLDAVLTIGPPSNTRPSYNIVKREINPQHI